MTNSLIGGRYRLGDPLGEGSGGSVFHARDEATGESVAVKLVGDTDPAREWRIGRRIVSEGIVRTRDFGVDSDRGGYVVLSLAAGKSLDEWWRERTAEPVPPWSELRSVIDQVIAALAAIHQAGWVHLDLKPAHILVADPGARTLLLDFGLARPIGVPLSDLTGTPHYVAPELARGGAPTPAADLFGLGACLYHAITGTPPHEGRDSRAILAAAQAGDHIAIDDVTPQSPLSLQDIPRSLIDIVEGLLLPHADGRGASTRPSRSAGTLPPFVGRSEALNDAAEWLRSRRGGVLRIAGEPGVGRSRLLSEVAAAARAQGCRVLEIAGEEPWMRAIETLERWSEALSVETGVDPRPGENAPWEAIHAYRAHRIGTLLDGLSGRIGAPLLLTVDGPDDPATLDLLHRSWTDAGFGAATLAAVCGSDGPSETIRIEALGVEECGELVENLVGGIGLRGPAIERLHAVSRGRPGPLLAIARRLDLPSLAVATDEDAVGAVDRASTHRSSEILDLLADLDAPSMRILEVVAILHDSAGAADLRAILSSHNPELEKDLGDLCDHGLLVRRDDGSLELGSEALAEIMDEELGRLRAQRLHQQVLESLGANAPDEAVAHHLIGAGRAEHAAPLLLAVAEWPGRDPSVARRAAENGIDALPAAHPLLPRLAIAAAAAVLRQGKRPDARTFATQAWRALAPSLGEAALPSAEEVADLLERAEPEEALLLSEAWSLHARTLLESEEETELIALLEPVLAHGPLAREPEKHDELVHQIRQSLGLALSNSGRAEEALPHLEATLEAADRRGDPIGRGYDLTAMAQALANLGRVEEADRAVIEAQAIADRFGVVPLSLTAAFSHGEAAYKLGRLDEAEKIFEELAQRAAAWNHIEVHVFAQQRLARFAALRGRHDEAIAHFDRVLPMVRELGHVNGLLIILTARANTLERWRRLPDAIRDLEEALEIARESGRIPSVAWIQVNLATDHMRAGDVRRSRDYVEQAGETLGSIDNDHHRLHLLRCWSNLELFLRRWDAAEERIEAGLALDASDPELLFKKIQLACRRMQPEQARKLLDAKRDAITRLPDPQTQRAAAVIEADVLLCEGRAAEATAAIHEVLDRGADTPPDHISGAAWLIAARAALKRGHLGTARRAIEDALESMAVVSSTDRVEASFLLAEIIATQGEEAAIELVERTAEAIGDSAEEAELRARADAAKTRVHEALRGAGAAPNAAASTGIELSLLAILEEIVAGDRLEGLLPRLLDLTLELLGGERGILFLVDPPTGVLAPAVQRSIDADSARDAETWSAGVLERSRGGELVLHDDAHGAEELKEFPSIARFGIRSVAAVPLLEGKVSVGAVYVDNRRKPLVISDASRAAFEALARIFARLIRRTVSIDELRGEADRLRTETSIAHDAERRVENRERWGGLVGASPPMLNLYGRLESLLAAARRIDRLPNILITGETGTGKDLVAKELATRCARKDRPYVRVSSADLAPTMVESALFGHRRGSFTGATHDHAGFFEQADGGVLFLDEIGDATPEVQAKLLRAIDNGEIQRLGDDKVREVDVWLITATNHDLQADVEAERFREDLLYRVREIEVHLPPLRERTGDVERLATHFLTLATRETEPCRLTRGARAALESYDWPGNVRDLKAKITGGIVGATDGIIGIEALDAEIQEAAAAAQISEGAQEPEKVAPIEDQIASFIRTSLARALREHGGNRTRAAESLGLSERKLRSWIARYAVPTPPSTRGRPPGS